jgi:hypothetical protein
MSTTILQSLKLKFNLCIKNKKTQIAWWDSWTKQLNLESKLNQNIV